MICPWHGSRFDLVSGAVVHGPAVFPQPAYEARILAGLPVALRQEGETEWIVRFGPVSREDMLAVLNGYVW